MTARAVLGAALAALAGLAAPLSVVAGWTNTLVSDPDTFAATYAPIVRSAPFQQVVVGRLSDAIIDKLGLDSPKTRKAVTKAVDEVASSKLFAEAATMSLGLMAEDVSRLLSEDQASSTARAGKIALPLAPFAEAAKKRLSENGVPFVDKLPPVTAGITVATLDPETLTKARSGRRTLDLLAGSLPWVAAGLATASLLIWPRKRSALIAIGLSLVVGAGVVGGAWWILIGALTDRLGSSLAPLTQAVAELTTRPMVTPLAVIGIGGAVLALLAALNRPRGRRRGTG